jgi:hypothetical protein
MCLRSRFHGTPPEWLWQTTAFRDRGACSAGFVACFAALKCRSAPSSIGTVDPDSARTVPYISHASCQL